MKTILLLGALLLLVAVWGIEANKKHTHADILDIIHKLSDYGRYGHKHGKGHQAVGFSASLASSITAGKANQAVVFGTVQTNIGAHYNSHNGIFTAPVDGMYSFQWTILTIHGKYGDTFLVVNGQIIRKNPCNSRAYGSFGFKSGSALVVLSLKRNDKVWVVIRGAGYYVYGGHWSSFHGLLQNRM